MRTDRAERLASGYAWGREDASGTRTAATDDRDGSYLFARAYAAAQDDYNRERRGSMMTVRDAYARWQDSGGRTIEDEHDFEAHLLGQARTWIAGRFPDTDTAVMSDQAIRSGMDRHHDGGWTAFRRAEQAAYYASRDDVADAAQLSRIESSACGN